MIRTRDGAEAWEPATLGDPCEVRLLRGQARHDGFDPQFYAGERWTRNPDGSWSNVDTYGFPAVPAGAELPDGVEIRRGDRIELSGDLPDSAITRTGIRIAAGALPLRPPATREST